MNLWLYLFIPYLWMLKMKPKGSSLKWIMHHLLYKPASCTNAKITRNFTCRISICIVTVCPDLLLVREGLLSHACFNNLFIFHFEEHLSGNVQHIDNVRITVNIYKSQLRISWHPQYISCTPYSSILHLTWPAEIHIIPALLLISELCICSCMLSGFTHPLSYLSALSLFVSM